MKSLLLLALLAPALIMTPLLAQDGAVELPPIGVTVTRLPTTLRTAGSALSAENGDSARRGRTFASLEEMLRFIPGVFAADRGDATVDQRITIRGSGARANFGIRGLRLLVDGIPATLPDGQSQLGALIPATIERIEIGRGPLGALHGNASSGVIAITTMDLPSRSALRGTVSLDGRGGSEGLVDAAALLRPGLGARLTFSRTERGAPRVHAHAEERLWNGSVGWRVTPSTTLTLRGSWLEMPFSESPGALTQAEFIADPRQAAARNVRLDAGKEVSQRQLALGVRHDAGQFAVGVHTWMLGRDLANPIAAPAPGDPSAGTWIDLDRQVRGIRTDLLWRATPRLTLTGGLDWQRMVDDRRNRIHRGKGALGGLIVNQEESVSEIGPFGHGQFRLSPLLTVQAGVRHDRTTFGVTDALDPLRSGTRAMGATTASTSLAWGHRDWDGWVGVAGSFETPTTTELANRADNATGLNTDLNPAHTTSVEVGVRHSTARFRLELAAWTARTRDAILPAQEVDGRSIFHNIPRTTSRGIEFTTSMLLSPDAQLRGTATLMDNRFGSEVLDAEGNSIGENALPGVPRLSAAAGVTWHPGDWTFDLDQQFRGRTAADDQGTLFADNWGGGVTNFHLGHTWQRLSADLTIRNLFDREVVSSVVVNAAAGRFIQPLPSRRITVGLSARL